MTQKEKKKLKKKNFRNQILLVMEPIVVLILGILIVGGFARLISVIRESHAAVQFTVTVDEQSVTMDRESAKMTVASYKEAGVEAEMEKVILDSDDYFERYLTAKLPGRFFKTIWPFNKWFAISFLFSCVGTMFMQKSGYSPEMTQQISILVGWMLVALIILLIIEKKAWKLRFQLDRDVESGKITQAQVDRIKAEQPLTKLGLLYVGVIVMTVILAMNTQNTVGWILLGAVIVMAIERIRLQKAYTKFRKEFLIDFGETLIENPRAKSKNPWKRFRRWLLGPERKRR